MDIGMAYEVSSLWLRVGEPRPQKDPISEADLSLIWQGQRFPPEALLTTDGRAVAVVNPGRRGGGSGPDFIDAVVLLDGVERRGDVELHVRASYFHFHGHGHDRDPAYTDLALHVVYLADEAETRLQDGSLAPVAAFAPWLRGRVEELHSWQRAPEMWREPCKGATQRLGEAAVRSALEAAGRQRFEARVERMAAAVGQLGGEEALWRGLLDTLGVGGDRAGFVRLAAAFLAELATAVEDLEAALLHVAGLGPEPDGAEALPRPLSPGLGSPGRPANRPQIRLAGLAALVRRALERTVRGRVEALSEMALASVTEAGSTGRRLAAWTVRPQIGTARAQELLVNAVLPFVATRGLKPEALALLRSLPAGTSYGKTAFLESNLRPDKGRIGRNALQSQGLLGYVRQWCSQDGCGKCPLSLEPGDTPGPPLKGA